MGDTHIVKRKHKALTQKHKARKKKKAIEQPVRSDESTTSDDDTRSPSYQESDDSSSKSDSDGDAGAQGGRSIPAATPLQFTNSLPLFAGETEFTHATQDEDHGAPQSQRTNVMEGARGKGRKYHYGTYLSPQESDTSFDATSESSHDYHHYMLPNPSTEQTPTWVYEWQDPGFYDMLFSQ